MSSRFAILLVAAILAISSQSYAITVPERQPDTPETSGACNAFDSCACSIGGSCVDVCADTWCAMASPSDACFRCIVQDQTLTVPGCGYDFAACYPSMSSCQ